MPAETDDEELKKAEKAKARDSDWLREAASGAVGTTGLAYVNCGRCRSGGLDPICQGDYYTAIDDIQRAYVGGGYPNLYP